MNAPSPTFESINSEYQRISGFLGEAYVRFDLARRELNNLKKQRDAVLAQFKLFQQLNEKEPPTDQVTQDGK